MSTIHCSIFHGPKHRLNER